MIIGSQVNRAEFSYAQVCNYPVPKYFTPVTKPYTSAASSDMPVGLKAFPCQVQGELTRSVFLFYPCCRVPR